MTAQAAKLAVGPPAASRRPPTPGPMKMAALSMVVEIAFAAVSSSGVRASAGMSTAWAGRNAVLTAAIAQAMA